MQRPINRAATGAGMAATSKLFSDARHIKFAFAAQAYSKASARQLAKKYRDFDISDGESVIHQAFAVLFFGPNPLHLLLRDPNPCQRTLPLQGRKRRA